MFSECTFCTELNVPSVSRATIEEEYGKKLAKLSKQTLGRDETGSVHRRIPNDRASAHFLLCALIESSALRWRPSEWRLISRLGAG